VSLAEGLQHSLRPCATRLSVAGFLAEMHRFLPGGRFILRVKRPSFPVQDPRIFNTGDKTVIGSRHNDMHGARYSRLGVQGGYVRAYIGE